MGCKDGIALQEGKLSWWFRRSNIACAMKQLALALVLLLLFLPYASADVGNVLVNEPTIVHMRSPESWRYLKDIRYNPIMNVLKGELAFCEGDLNISRIEYNNGPVLSITFTSYVTRKGLTYIIADAPQFVETLNRSIASKSTLQPGVLSQKGIYLNDGSRSNYILEYTAKEEGDFALKLDRANIGITIILSENALQSVARNIEPVRSQPEIRSSSPEGWLERKEAYLTGTNVNLRAEPNANAPVIATLKGYEGLNAYRASNDGKWINVEAYLEEGSRRGWVFSEYIGYPLKSQNRISMELFKKTLTAMGKNKAEVLQRLGNPDRIEHYEGTPGTDDTPSDTFFYPGATLSFSAYSEKFDIEFITTTKYEILQGIPIGSSSTILKEKLGEPSIMLVKKTVEEWIYETQTNEGMYQERLSFTITKGKVVEVTAWYY